MSGCFRPLHVGALVESVLIDLQAVQFDTDTLMKIPPDYVPHLDHRITSLMAFTVRRDRGWFCAGSGDLYRASLEGSGIMLRMLMEFLGVKANRKKPTELTVSNDGDVRLGIGGLKLIEPVKPDVVNRTVDGPFLARMHSEASKRTAHPQFFELKSGLDPDDLRKATKWVVGDIWRRCYEPDAITVHGDLFCLLQNGRWEDIPFKSA